MLGLEDNTTHSVADYLVFPILEIINQLLLIGYYSHTMDYVKSQHFLLMSLHV